MAFSVGILILFTMVTSCACDDKRPFYIIAHMVNSIEQIEHYLNLGANVIESDIQFYTNGSVKETFHGFPCDCFRTCNRRANLQQYLQHVRDITDPSLQGNYGNRMVMQFFDLKLSTVENKKESGRDIARHVVEYLWSKDKKRKQEVRALIYIDSDKDKDAFVGFIEEFKKRGLESRLKDVGFDGGSGGLDEIRRMFAQLGIQKNIWLGDGKSNCLSAIYPDYRLQRELAIRESRSAFIHKVYHWTIDLKLRMRRSLYLGVDGMITNDPYDLVEVLQESDFRSTYRIATPEDNPFERFESK